MSLINFFSSNAGIILHVFDGFLSTLWINLAAAGRALKQNKGNLFLGNAKKGISTTGKWFTGLSYFFLICSIIIDPIADNAPQVNHILFATASNLQVLFAFVWAFTLQDIRPTLPNVLSVICTFAMVGCIMFITTQKKKTNAHKPAVQQDMLDFVQKWFGTKIDETAPKEKKERETRFFSYLGVTILLVIIGLVTYFASRSKSASAAALGLALCCASIDAFQSILNVLLPTFVFDIKSKSTFANWGYGIAFILLTILLGSSQIYIKTLMKPEYVNIFFTTFLPLLFLCQNVKSLLLFQEDKIYLKEENSSEYSWRMIYVYSLLLLGSLTGVFIKFLM